MSAVTFHADLGARVTGLDVPLALQAQTAGVVWTRIALLAAALQWAAVAETAIAAAGIRPPLLGAVPTLGAFDAAAQQAATEGRSLYFDPFPGISTDAATQGVPAAVSAGVHYLAMRRLLRLRLTTARPTSAAAQIDHARPGAAASVPSPIPGGVPIPVPMPQAPGGVPVLPKPGDTIDTPFGPVTIPSGLADGVDIEVGALDLGQGTTVNVTGGASAIVSSLGGDAADASHVVTARRDVEACKEVELSTQACAVRAQLGQPSDVPAVVGALAKAEAREVAWWPAAGVAGAALVGGAALGVGRQGS